MLPAVPRRCLVLALMLAVPGAGCRDRQDALAGGNSKQRRAKRKRHTRSALAAGRTEQVAEGLGLVRGLAVDAEGTVWISDYAGDRVLAARWGSEGLSAPEVRYTGLGGPAALAFEPRGSLLVALPSQRSVLRITGERREVVFDSRIAGREVLGPTGLAVSAEGLVYIADPGGVGGEAMGSVYVLHEAGAQRLDAGLAAPYDVALAPHGRMLYVSDVRTNAVYPVPVRANGHLADRRVAVRTDFGKPMGLAVDVRGHLFVAAGRSVRAATPTGEGMGSLPFADPRVVALAFAGPDGRTLLAAGGGSLWATPMRHAGGLFRRVPSVVR